MKLRSVLSAPTLAAAPAAVVPGGATGAGATAPGDGVARTGHAAAASTLGQSGITCSSSGGCSDRHTPTCTSFTRLGLATAQGAQPLKSATGCALDVTGGTGPRTTRTPRTPRTSYTTTAAVAGR